MSVGEILDGAFVLLRRHFGALFTVAVLCLAIPTAIDIYLQFSLGQMAPMARPGLFGSARLLEIIGYLLATGAAVRIVSDAYLGRSAGAGRALGFAVGKMWGIFVSGLAATIVIFIAAIPAMITVFYAVMTFATGDLGTGGALFAAGLVLCLLPIYIATGYAVTVQSVVLEKLPAPTSALGRSWSLTKGHRGRAIVLWIVVLILLVLFSAGVGIVAEMLRALSPPLWIAAVAALSLVRIMVYPLIACVFTLLYYDLRVRKEAFDLEHLSQQIGLAPTRA
jgi:hypothetical protein